MGDALWATLILAAMCGLMYWAAQIARKRLGIGAGTIGPEALKVVGKRQLDPKKAIYIVEIGDRYVLLGAAESSVSMLDHVTPEEFASMLPVDDAPVRKIRSLPKPKNALGYQQASASDDHDVDDDVELTEVGVSPAAGDESEREFMTPKESFKYLMAKARDARSDRKASGD